MFYPNWLVSDLVFCVAENSEYLDMLCFPRLEYETTSYAISGKTFFPRSLINGQAMKKWIKITLISIFSIFILSLLAITYYVESRVQETCKMAISLYPGDKVDALISVSKSQSSCTTNKSRALWALGQLGNKKALPYLIDNYESIEETDICVYEAQFAIEKIKNESFNLPGFLWRTILES